MITESFCLSCANYIGEVNGRDVCKAFPEEIPVAILVGDELHLEPTGNDNGVVFEPTPGNESSAELARMFAAMTTKQALAGL